MFMKFVWKVPVNGRFVSQSDRQTVEELLVRQGFVKKRRNVASLICKQNFNLGWGRKEGKVKILTLHEKDTVSR